MDAPIAARLRRAFEENFARGHEVGAAVSVWRDGVEVASASGGFRDAERRLPWQADTPVLIWSATKGIAAACAIHAISRRGFDLDSRVVEIWPEFGRAGKEAITLGQVLSHSAGLGALDRMDLSVLDHESVARAIEEQEPFAPAGSGPGYGPRTFGFIVDEIVRRLDGGTPLGNYWRREFGDPLHLDLWIGMPAEEHARVASILAPKAGVTARNAEFLEALSRPDSLTRKAFSSPGGLLAVSSMNSPSARSASIPSMGGIGTASALAGFYSLLAEGGVRNGVRFFTPEACGWMSTRRSQGFDCILRVDTSFSAGFMMDPLDSTGRKARSLMGPSLRSFGHPGAGGSLGFADPENRLSFAYVMNQMEQGVLPGERAADLVQSLYQSPA